MLGLSHIFKIFSFSLQLLLWYERNMLLPLRKAPLLVEERCCLALLGRPSRSVLTGDLACAEVLCVVELVALASFMVPHVAAEFLILDDVIVVRRIHQQLLGVVIVGPQRSLRHVLRVTALRRSHTIGCECLYLGLIPHLLIIRLA